MSSMDLSYEADTEPEFKNNEYNDLLDNLEHSKFLVKNIDLGNVGDELLENIFQFIVLLNEKFSIYKENICFDGDNEIYRNSTFELKRNLNYISFRFIELDEKIEEIEHNGYLDFNIMLPILREILILTIDIQDKILICNDICLREKDENEIANIFGDMRI